MDKKATLAGLILIALLGSCSSPASLSSRIYVEPTEGTYDPSRKFKEESPVDLTSIGLEKDIDERIPKPLTPWRGRTDGSLDPYLHLKPNQAPNGALPTEGGYDNRYCDYPASLFNNDAYVYVANTGWYTDVCDAQKGCYPCFYDLSALLDPPSGIAGGVSIDAVYSHGVWSYVANFSYIGKGSLAEYALFGDYGLSIIWSIKHCSLEVYPYSIYFDHYRVYFMSKDSAFPNDYLDAFNQAEGIHLLYA